MRTRIKAFRFFAALFAAAIFAPVAVAERTGAFTDIHAQEHIFGVHPGGDDGAGPVKDISFELYVPPAYDRDDPPGLLVFISPVIRGKPPDRLKRMLDEQNLIWISVNDSGDRTEDLERMIEAYGSLAYALDRYRIDYRRRYLGGFAGGARVASLFAQDYPQFFNGYLFFAGAEHWREPAKGDLRRYKKDWFAFVVGRNDMAADPVRRSYESFADAGLENIELFEIEGLAHRLPDAAAFGDVVDYLDRRRP